MLGKITAQNFQKQQDSQSYKGKSDKKMDAQADGNPEAPKEGEEKSFPSLSSSNLKNILEQLNNSPYYKKKRLSFRMKEPSEGKVHEIEVLKLDLSDTPSHVQNLSLERLFKLWVQHKLYQKAPDKGGFLNISW